MSPMFQPELDKSNNKLELYNLVTHHPDATFFFKYEGSDLEDLGIYTNDILIIDRSIKPSAGKISVIIRDDEFKIEKILEKNSREINHWGVINYIIHKT